MLFISSLAWLALSGCSPGQRTLRLVHGSTDATDAIAGMLAAESRAFDSGIRLELVPEVAGTAAALEAVADGRADLAVVENSSRFDRQEIRTIAPLFPSILHIGVRQGRQASTLRELLAGATVFAGPQDSAGHLLLDLLRPGYSAAGIDFSYVSDVSSEPDLIFLFAPISPERAFAFEGYELFSLGDAESLGAGTAAEALDLLAPRIRPFVIPATVYGSLTPGPVLTVAIDTLLVAHRDTSRITIYDLLRDIQASGPSLAAERPDLMVDSLESFEISGLTFPLHAGAQTFRARSEPGFYERTAGIIDAIIAALAGIGAVSLAFYRYLRSRRKSRIDGFYEQVLAIRARAIASADEESWHSARNELRLVRNDAFSLLMRERLYADDSFRILQELISDVLVELTLHGQNEQK